MRNLNIVVFIILFCEFFIGGIPLLFCINSVWAGTVEEGIMIQQQQTMIFNQEVQIAKMAEDIAEITKVLSTLNDQLSNLKDQLDLQKQINEGADAIPGLKDVKTLYGSILDLQEGFNNTVANVDALQKEIESYFGPVEFEDVEWGDRYQGIKVGRQTATLSLVAALELKEKTKEAEESIWSLMEQDIEGLDPKGLNKFIAQALKNLLTLQFFQAKAQAQQTEADASEQLSGNSKEKKAAEATKYWEDANLEFIQNLSDIAFYTKTDWKMGASKK